MRMMDELRPLFLYSAKKRVYVPIDEEDRRHNSAILLLSPSLESSDKLLRLPYLYNPKLFTSFYIDRNVMSYIDNESIDIDFDEQEEEIVSEAMLRNFNTKTKIKFDDKVSVMDKRYAEEVLYPDMVRKIIRENSITYTPKNIKVFVHPNVASLRDGAPSKIARVYEDKLYSYSDGEELHVVSKMVYDPEIMGGTYDLYLKNELICNIFMQANPDLSLLAVCAIAQVLSGIYDWVKENKDFNNIDIGTEKINKFAKSVYLVLSKNQRQVITKYLKTNNLNVFTAYSVGNTLSNIKKFLFEADLSYYERQRLLPSEFGVPNKRKYPINDEDHVTQAIRMFNNCDPSDEAELAENIIKKIKKFGMTDIKVSAANKFKQYYDNYMATENKDSDSILGKALDKADEKISGLVDKGKDKVNEKISDVKSKAKDKLNELKDKGIARLEEIIKKEQVLMEEGSFGNSDYADILTICNHLDPNEFKRVSFYDTYRDSKFVIKRIIKRNTDGTPAGFLDVYLFPSKPHIAQITIAVAKEFRGYGFAKEMVEELVNSNLQELYGFDMYYWTSHPDNKASQCLALRNGFVDTNKLDNYGRKVFINTLGKDLDYLKLIQGELKPDEPTITEDSLMTESMVLLEANKEKVMSQKLKQYLYKERIKNNKETTQIYDRIKESNPEIKRTYLKIAMYRKQNVFIDLSYYHALFLKNNKFRADKGINFYFEFLNRLIDNKEINAEYSKRTIFIPVDMRDWNVTDPDDIFDYKKSINPFSMIVRLTRMNLAMLKKSWGNRSVVFVGSKGYFTVDFKNFEMKNLIKFKSNITKLLSSEEVIDDGDEIDDLEDDSIDPMMPKETGADVKRKNVNSSKATTAKIIDSIENNMDIKVDNIKASKPAEKSDSKHLEMIDGNIDVGDNKNNVAIISIDPDGADGYKKISDTILSDIGKVSTFCIPK